MSKCREMLERHGLKWTISADCGDGWVPLLDSLIVDLKALGWDGELHQVKEKFGGLRFYIGAGSKEVHDRITKAKNDSFDTCEVCGKPGALREGGWIKTLCDEHDASRSKR